MSKKQKTMRFPALLLVLCLVTGALVTDKILHLTKTDENRIVVAGEMDSNPKATISRKLSKEELRTLGYYIVSDETMWGTKTEVEIFHMKYNGVTGDITVEGANSDKVIAPGTSNDYHFVLKNEEQDKVRYRVWMEATVEPEDLDLPVLVRVEGPNGRWVLGGEDQWLEPLALNQIDDHDVLNAGEAYNYTLSWQWPYEQGDDQKDTALGNRAVDEDLRLSINIYTTAFYTGEDDDGGNTGGGGKKPTETTAAQEITAADQNPGNTNTTGGNTTNGSHTGIGNNSTGNDGYTSADGNGTGNTGTDGNINGNSGTISDGTGKKDTDQNGIDDSQGKTGETEITVSTEEETTGWKFPWWLLGLLALLAGILWLILWWGRRIYLTGFLHGAEGCKIRWKKKEDVVREDGRFEFRGFKTGSHKFELEMPDGTVTEWNWKLKRGDDEGVIFEQDGQLPVVTTQKKTRAIELYLDLREKQVQIDTGRWAIIDNKRNVYTPEGKNPPKSDKTNRTPGGMTVDEKKKFDFD